MHDVYLAPIRKLGPFGDDLKAWTLSGTQDERVSFSTKASFLTTNMVQLVLDADRAGSVRFTFFTYDFQRCTKLPVVDPSHTALEVGFFRRLV